MLICTEVFLWLTQHTQKLF